MKEYKGYNVSKDGVIFGKRGKPVGYNSNGYRQFKTYNKVYYIHRFVWEAFNGPIPNGYEIDHINFNRSDNRLENLQLLSREDNVQKSHNSLSNKQVTQIRDLATKGISYSNIAKEVGTSPSTAWLAATKKTYKNIR